MITTTPEASGTMEASSTQLVGLITHHHHQYHHHHIHYHHHHYYQCSHTSKANHFSRTASSYSRCFVYQLYAGNSPFKVISNNGVVNVFLSAIFLRLAVGQI